MFCPSCAFCPCIFFSSAQASLTLLIFHWSLLSISLVPQERFYSVLETMPKDLNDLIWGYLAVGNQWFVCGQLLSRANRPGVVEGILNRIMFSCFFSLSRSLFLFLPPSLCVCVCVCFSLLLLSAVPFFLQAQHHPTPCLRFPLRNHLSLLW